MARIDDVLLNAYIDGELGHEDVSEVSLALRDDPEAARRLACFQRLDSLMHQAYDPILNAPIPDRLLAATQTKKSSWPVYKSSMAYLPTRSVIAAGIAFIFVVAGTYAGTSWHVDRLQRVEQVARLKDESLQKAAIQYALERERSGNATQWVNPDSGNAGSVVPVRTFQDRSGQFCREFQIIAEGPPPAQPILAVACRNEQGVWDERFRVLTKSEGPLPLAPETPVKRDVKPESKI